MSASCAKIHSSALGFSVIWLANQFLRNALYMVLVTYRGGSVAEWLACWTQAQKARVQIAVATLSGNSLKQTAHTHCASVHQAAKLVAAFIRVARVIAGLAESNGSLPPGLRFTSPTGWLPRTGISSGTLRSVVEYGLPLPFSYTQCRYTAHDDKAASVGCPHSMQSRVYVTVRRLSVCPIDRQQQRRPAGEVAAERTAVSENVLPTTKNF